MHIWVGSCNYNTVNSTTHLKLYYLLPHPKFGFPHMNILAAPRVSSLWKRNTITNRVCYSVYHVFHHLRSNRKGHFLVEDVACSWNQCFDWHLTDFACCKFNLPHKVHFVKVGLFIIQSVQAVDRFFPTVLVLPKFDSIGRLWVDWPGNLITFPNCIYFFEVFYTKITLQAMFLYMLPVRCWVLIIVRDF